MSQTAAPKEKRLTIRATEPEKELLAQAAKARRTNVSRFILEASLDAANAVLVDRTLYHLPPEQWDAFCRRLDDSPKTIPALQQLFREDGPF